MIRLQEVKLEDRELLWNINQKYLYEMTMYYPDEMDEQGNYYYGYFEAYFTDAKRKAFFIYDEETLVGFAMLNPYSYIEHQPDYTMAEFTIFPSYRRKHYAIDAVDLILSGNRGKWEIKYNEKNTGAKKLWTTVTKPYAPVVYHINAEETVLEFTN
jgi:predicted acetyltransferase